MTFVFCDTLMLYVTHFRRWYSTKGLRWIARLGFFIKNTRLEHDTVFWMDRFQIVCHVQIIFRLRLSNEFISRKLTDSFSISIFSLACGDTDFTDFVCFTLHRFSFSHSSSPIFQVVLYLFFKAPCYYNPRRVVFLFSGLKCGQLGGRVSWLWWAGHSDCLTPIGCRRIGGWSTPGQNRQVARPPNIQELQQCSLNRIS